MDTKSLVAQTAKTQEPNVDQSKFISFGIQQQQKQQTSRLPWVIQYNRKKAALLFKHARSKEHGLKHIDKRKGMLALFWIGTFITVMTILIIMVVDLCRRFASNPVATQIKAEQDGILFPDISICAKAPFHTHTKVNQSDPTKDLLVQLSKQITQKLKDSSIKLTKASTEASLLIQMATRQETQNLRAFQHIIYCQYNQKDCSFYNFTEIVHLRYLQCFTFSPNTKIISGGRGLQFIYFKSHGDDKPFMMLNDLEDEAFQTEAYDGIHILVHNPGTFPTYKISSMPTSFSLRFGQQAHIEVSGLNYRSDMSGRKSCIVKADDYKYTNFRGGANYLEYRYTFEDCVANMKQRWIRQQCDCFSDDLFVPFQSAEEEALRREEYHADVQFCRDIRAKTSQVIREQFLCHEQYEKMPTTTVLDQFIDADKLFNTRENLDARKVLRHQICSLPCEKQIYLTKFFEVSEMDPNGGFPVSILSTYIDQLRESRLQNDELQNIWERFRQGSYETLPYNNTIVVEIRAAAERIDAWEEELTESLFNLISNLGGTLGLCAGISFLSSFFLLVFFGRAFIHAFVSFVLWFWWAVYLAKPPTPNRDVEKHPNSATSGDAISVSSPGVSRISDSGVSKPTNLEPKIKEYQHMVEKTGDSFEPETTVNIEKVETPNPSPEVTAKEASPIKPTAPSEITPTFVVTKQPQEETGTPLVDRKPAEIPTIPDHVPPQQERTSQSRKGSIPELSKVPSIERTDTAIQRVKETIKSRITPILKISRTSSESKAEGEEEDDDDEGEEKKEEEEDSKEKEERESEDEEKEEETEEEQEESESVVSENTSETVTTEGGEDNTQEEEPTETTSTRSDEEANNAVKNNRKNSLGWQKVPRIRETNPKGTRQDKEKGWYDQTVPGMTKKEDIRAHQNLLKKNNQDYLRKGNELPKQVQPNLLKKNNLDNSRRSSVQPPPPFSVTRPQGRSKPYENKRLNRGQVRKSQVESSESDKDPFGLTPLRRSSIDYPFEDETIKTQQTINLNESDQSPYSHMNPSTVIPIPPKLRTYNNDQNQKIYAFEDDETFSPPLRTLIDQKLVPGYIESLYMRSNPHSAPHY